MSNASEAADFIKRQAALLQGYVQLADTLDRIGSVELAAKEAQAARETAEAARDVALGELANAKTQVDEANTEAARILVDASTAAKASADSIVQSAKDQAAAIVSAARAQANAVEQASQARADAANQTLADLIEPTSRAQAQLADITAAVLTRQAEFERLEAAISDLRAKILA